MLKTWGVNYKMKNDDKERAEGVPFKNDNNIYETIVIFYGSEMGLRYMHLNGNFYVDTLSISSGYP